MQRYNHQKNTVLFGTVLAHCGTLQSNVLLGQKMILFIFLGCSRDYAEMSTMRWCAVGCHCNWVNIGFAASFWSILQNFGTVFPFTGRRQCHPNHYCDWQQPSKHWEKGSRAEAPLLWLNTEKPWCPIKIALKKTFHLFFLFQFWFFNINFESFKIAVHRLFLACLHCNFPYDQVENQWSNKKSVKTVEVEGWLGFNYYRTAQWKKI